MAVWTRSTGKPHRLRWTGPQTAVGASRLKQIEEGAASQCETQLTVVQLKKWAKINCYRGAALERSAETLHAKKKCILKYFSVNKRKRKKYNQFVVCWISPESFTRAKPYSYLLKQLTNLTKEYKTYESTNRKRVGNKVDFFEAGHRLRKQNTTHESRVRIHYC